MKKTILLLMFISTFGFGYAAVVLKTVSNVTAGTLSTRFIAGELTTVTNLTVTGTLDATDFKFMRDQLTVLYSLNISGTSIAAYTGTAGTFPGGVSTTYPADALPQYSFFDGTNGKNTLVVLTLPNTINTIDTYALKKASITSLTIPNSVTTINAFGIQGCSALASLTLSSNLTTIGVSAFSYDTKLTSIFIPASVTSLGNNAFDNCLLLATVNMGSSMPIALNLSGNVFRNIASTNTLNVPVGSSNAYKAINTWAAFTSINELSTAVNELSQESIMVYPTKVNDQIYFKGLTGAAKISILNSVGKVYQNEIVTNDNAITVKSLPSGIYFLRINEGTNQFVRKFIKL